MVTETQTDLVYEKITCVYDQFCQTVLVVYSNYKRIPSFEQRVMLS